MNAYSKPSWWTLFALLPLLIVLFAVESQLALPALGHQIAQIGIVLVFVGLLGLWTMANAPALIYDDMRDIYFVREATDDVLSGFAGDTVELAPEAWPEAEPQAWLGARSRKQTSAAGLSQERYN